MKPIALVIAILLAAAAPAHAQTAGEPGGGIRAVISAQIDAFRAGDFARAFGFASDGIRQIFINPDNFGAMVERGYAMVVDPAEVRYGEIREEGGALVQRVLMRDAAGRWHALDYLMIEQDGGWRIAGVEIVGPPEVGA